MKKCKRDYFSSSVCINVLESSLDNVILRNNYFDYHLSKFNINDLGIICFNSKEDLIKTANIFSRYFTNNFNSVLEYVWKEYKGSVKPLHDLYVNRLNISNNIKNDSFGLDLDNSFNLIFHNEFNELIVGDTYYCYNFKHQIIIIENSLINTKLISKLRLYLANGDRNSILSDILINDQVIIQNRDESYTINLNVITLINNGRNNYYSIDSDFFSNDPIVKINNVIYQGLVNEIFDNYSSLNEDVSKSMIDISVVGFINGIGYIKIKKIAYHSFYLPENRFGASSKCSIDFDSLKEFYVVTDNQDLKFKFNLKVVHKCTSATTASVKVEIFDPNNQLVFNKTILVASEQYGVVQNHDVEVEIDKDDAQIGSYTVNVSMSLGCCIGKIEKTKVFNVVAENQCCNGNVWFWTQNNGEWIEAFSEGKLYRRKLIFKRENFSTYTAITASILIQVKQLSWNLFDWDWNPITVKECFVETFGGVWQFKDGKCELNDWQYIYNGGLNYSSASTTLFFDPDVYIEKNGFSAWFKLHFAGVYIEYRYITMPPECN